VNALRAWLGRLFATIGGERLDRDLADELDSHLQLHADDNVRAGITPAEARRQAHLRLGGLDQTKERYRDRRGVAGLDHALYDLRLAVRAWARRPLLLASAVLSIAIGVGANVAVYAVLKQLFVADWISSSDPEGLITIRPGLSYLNYQDLRRSDTGADIALLTTTTLTCRTQDLTTSVAARVVTDNFFDVLGTRAYRGSLFSARDRGGPDDARRAVISFGFWQRLGADDSIIGRTMTLNGWPFTIIGVLPRDLFFAVGPLVTASVLVPVSPEIATALNRREAGYFDVIARLHPGVSREQATASLQSAANRLEEAFPDANRDFARSLFVLPGPIGPLQAIVQAPQGRLVLALIAAVYGTVGLVLLIACANVATILTARADERRHETAVRTALGASRARLVQQFLAESLVIALLGCAAGGLLWTVTATLLPRLPAIVNAGIEIVSGPIPFLYCAGLAIVVAMASGLAPALTASQVAPLHGLKTGRLGHVVRGVRLQSVLVGGQVALSFVLLTAAFVLLHTFFLLRVTDPGYDVQHTAGIALRPGGNTVSADGLKSLVASVPGVDAVSFGALPLGAAGSVLPRSATVRVGADGPSVGVQLHPAGPQFLATLGIPLNRGRDLREEDLGATAGVIVNETFVRRYVSSADPIDQDIVLERNTETGRPDRRLRIVGVARDTKMRSLADEEVPVVYLPGRSLSVIVRTRAQATSVAPALERAVADRFPGSSVFVTTMSSQVNSALLPSRIAATLLSALGAIGLLLSMIGLHGIVRHAAARRSFEIGVRMALGATRAAVIGLVIRGATRVVTLGCAAGALIAAVALQVLRPLLAVGQSAIDPLAFAGVAAIFLFAATAASLLPARRAAAADPTIALRSE
jgi:predicted permease